MDLPCQAIDSNEFGKVIMAVPLLERLYVSTTYINHSMMMKYLNLFQSKLKAIHLKQVSRSHLLCFEGVKKSGMWTLEDSEIEVDAYPEHLFKEFYDAAHLLP